MIGVIALFVALGGTGYAALNIPRNSVGTPQLRNGAVTQKKLSEGSIAGSIVFWARLSATGALLGSSKPASVKGWASGTGNIIFRGVLPANCFPLANVSGFPTGYVGTASSQSRVGHTTIDLLFGVPGAPQPLQDPVNVAEICP